MNFHIRVEAIQAGSLTDRTAAIARKVDGRVGQSPESA